MNNEELSVLITCAVALDMAARLLAEESSTTSQDKWLETIMDRAYTRQLKMTPVESRALIDRMLKALNIPLESLDHLLPQSGAN